MVLLIVNEQHQVSIILCNLKELTLTSRIGPTVVHATLSLNLEIALHAWLRITFIFSFAALPGQPFTPICPSLSPNSTLNWPQFDRVHFHP